MQIVAAAGLVLAPRIPRQARPELGEAKVGPRRWCVPLIGSTEIIGYTRVMPWKQSSTTWTACAVPNSSSSEHVHCRGCQHQRVPTSLPTQHHTGLCSRQSRQQRIAPLRHPSRGSCAPKAAGTARVPRQRHADIARELRWATHASKPHNASTAQ